MNIDNKKIAIVYDWMDKRGGVERVLLAFHEMFPKAEFFTSYFDPVVADWAKDLVVHTSFIQKLPNFIKKSRLLSFIFYPYAFESFDFGNYDLVISITSSFAKSVITKPTTLHICYLLTPTRYLWLYPQEYLNGFQRFLLSYYINLLKHWDKIVSQRPDKIIAISKTVAERCLKYYGQEAEIVYPPFDINYWNTVKSCNSKLKSLENKEYFLIVSRLEPYKKVDLAIKVFNKLKDKQLIVVGEGSQKKSLEKMSKENIKFLGYVSDQDLACLYSGAKALIMPQEEDFGYVSLEAQFFNCPVIAYKKGGATETVIEGKTGLFFEHQSEEYLIKAIERFDNKHYNWKSSVNSYIKQYESSNFCRRFRNAFMAFVT